MKKLFNTILVPVDFSKASRLAVSKAVDIANDFSCNLHILHITVPSLVTGREPEARAQMAALYDEYHPLLAKGLAMQMAIRKGNVENVIVEYTIQHYIDLLMLGKSQRMVLGDLFNTISINRLSRKVPCPVLTVKTKPSFDKIENIVLPVGGRLPLRKIMFASYLASPSNARIHLVALSKKYAATEHAAYLFKAYELLKDKANLSVECHTVPGDNIAEKTLDYAEQINADLIVVNSGKELLLPGLVNKLFARFIVNESHIPVMTVAPEYAI